ncbi:glutaminyl-peptide cyclotransferase [Telmatobacter sp. DSM 110680]|uniref:Glutaminyl-peptide cyclotransferase n=1 Tax=Telmatobacter sp. DSM 110680 TaxID=3036704 RepID=A0AAU7DPV7_9BACT
MKFQKLRACLQSCWLIVLFVLVFAPVSNTSAQTSQTYRIVRTYPHDQQAFTQGLIYVDGHLYESTGKEGHSSLREEDLETGRILRMQLVSDKYFAEGLTEWKNTLVQLTWQSHVALVYDRATFRVLRTFSYPEEGWGLTHDAKSLILSDGSATLHFFDPETFHETRRITVKDNGKAVTELNELEFIHGEIYANVWHTDRIARISPASGRVIGWIDLKGLMPRSQLTDDEAVLNGIAYDAARDRLFVTGKLWPKIFEITLVPEKAKLVPVQHSK